MKYLIVIIFALTTHHLRAETPQFSIGYERVPQPTLTVGVYKGHHRLAGFFSNSLNYRSRGILYGYSLEGWHRDSRYIKTYAEDRIFPENHQDDVFKGQRAFHFTVMVGQQVYFFCNNMSLHTSFGWQYNTNPIDDHRPTVMGIGKSDEERFYPAGEVMISYHL